MPELKMMLIFVRHGQTFNNAEKKINGLLNDKSASLTPAGIDEAIRLSKFAEKKNVNFIYSSPLHRAMQTSEHVSEKLKLKIHADERLVECNFGSWEGKKESEVNQKEWKKREKQRYAYVYPGEFNKIRGESYSDMFPRVSSFIKDIVKKHKKNDVILIVTHTGVLLNVWKYFENLDEDALGARKVSNHDAYLVNTENNLTEEIPY